MDADAARAARDTPAEVVLSVIERAQRVVRGDDRAGRLLRVCPADVELPVAAPFAAGVQLQVPWRAGRGVVDEDGAGIATDVPRGVDRFDREGVRTVRDAGQ